ncbi:unnamed protein product [Prorocentrum cordatum]|uniref:Acyltransferase 3 domain-containing protein n=1 Tax=Prorocentrum cordatum TaxID=2364126 RepID=A0ABN9Y0C5_9DINO|nr:unnamed protein product [Polarella glacialis]
MGSRQRAGKCPKVGRLYEGCGSFSGLWSCIALATLGRSTAELAPEIPSWSCRHSPRGCEEFYTLRGAATSPHTLADHMLAHKVVYFQGPDPSCWGGHRNWHACCTVEIAAGFVEMLPPGNTQCWTHGLTFERCCIGHALKLSVPGWMFAPIQGDGDQLPSDRLPGGCPEAYEAYAIVGSLEGFPRGDAWWFHAIHPFDPIVDPHWHVVESGHLLLWIPQELTGTVGIRRRFNSTSQADAALHVASIVIEPDGGSVFFHQWACVAGPPALAYNRARILARTWAPLWNAIAYDWVGLWVRELPSTWRRAQSLGQAADLDLLSIDIVHAQETRPICVAAGDSEPASCDWSRMPSFVGIVVVFCALPGLASLPRASTALFSSDGSASIILDVWRVVMTVLVVCAHLQNVPVLQEYHISGNLLALALSVRLQGAPCGVLARIGRRFARQLPLRAVVCLLWLFCVRGLFSLSLTGRPWLVPRPLRHKAHLLDETASMATRHYEESGWGFLSELFVPPSLWFSVGEYPMKVSVNMWFFRAESTAWVLVMVCRRVGVVGWLMLGGIVLAEVRSIVLGGADADREEWDTPAKAFPIIVTAYISASAWRTACCGRRWYVLASAGILAAGAALWFQWCALCSNGTGNMAPGARRTACWMVALSWSCLYTIGMVGCLDVGASGFSVVFRAAPILRAVLGSWAKLGFGVCVVGDKVISLFWTGLDTRFWERARAASLPQCYVTALVASAAAFVFIQTPAQIACDWLWSMAPGLASRGYVCKSGSSKVHSD